MMTPEQRAAATAMLGQGTAAQAAATLDPNARQQQLQMAEQAAMGGAMPPQPPVQAPPQMQPGVLARLLQMLRR